MAEQNAEISEEYALRLQKKGEWILIAVAFALMVLAIVALSVGMQYAPYVTRKVIDYETGATEIRNVGPRYGGYDEMLGGMITAVIANFVLFVILQPSIWVSKKTGEPSIISKILKAALHVLAVIAILIAVLVAGIGYMSASKLELIGTDSAGDPEG